MFGCAGRIGCAIVLLVLGAVGWHYRAKWVPKVKALISRETGIKLGANTDGLAYTWEQG